MRKIRISFALGMLALALLANAQEKTERTLQVKLNYTGSGTVDASHKIFVFVFDSPDFVQGTVMPVGSQTADKKDQTVTVSGLSASTVYVVAAYDPKGAYDGMSGPPPSGSSLGMYSKDPGKPEPITLEAGKTARIELAFDDSAKMQ